MSRTDRPRIGIDLGGSKIEAALLAPDGSMLDRQRVATPRQNYDATLEAVVQLVGALRDRVGGDASVGVGTPGALSPATGLLKNANSVWLNGRPLLRDLERRLGGPVRMANDADCFTLSEAVDGAASEAKIVFGVILGTGVGGGVVVHQRPLAGPNAISGEWGHNQLPWAGDTELPGPECYCGKRGCIETFLSGPGLQADHLRASGARLAPEQIVRQAAEDDPLAEATLARYEMRLARALAGVINLLDPHVIVLGGGLSNVQRWYESVPQLWQPWVFSDRVDTRLVPPRHGDSSGVRGAAWLW